LDKKNHEKTMERPFSHGFPIGFSWILGEKTHGKTMEKAIRPQDFGIR
jgi:hypothetical protein